MGGRQGSASQQERCGERSLPRSPCSPTPVSHPSRRARHRRGLARCKWRSRCPNGRIVLDVTVMTTHLFLAAYGIYLTLLAAVTYFTRATRRRFAGALAGGVAVAAVG